MVKLKCFGKHLIYCISVEEVVSEAFLHVSVGSLFGGAADHRSWRAAAVHAVRGRIICLSGGPGICILADEKEKLK